MRFSNTTGCFYPKSQTYAELPADIQDVTMDDFDRAQQRPLGYTVALVAGVIVVSPPVPQTLAELKVALCIAVDEESEATRQAAVGDSMRAVEYEYTAKAADEFKAANYLGDPPPAVLSWMLASNLDATAATDDILDKRRRYIDALLTVRDIRLRAKANIMNAVDTAEAQSISDEAVEYLQGITAIVTGI